MFKPFINVLKKIVFSILLAESLCCCGGQADSPTSAGSANPNSIIPNSPTLSKYQFLAKVDLQGGTPPFPAAIGDTIIGTFTFDPSVNNTFVLPTQGNYIQKSPASVQVTIGSVTINSDLTNWLGYDITIMNNDRGYGETIDTLSWYINDTTLGAFYGLDYIQVGFRLTDSTGKAFASVDIPSNLDLGAFDSNLLFISGTKTINNIPNGLWSLRAEIKSLEKVQ